jgi:hypothetical protein
LNDINFILKLFKYSTVLILLKIWSEITMAITRKPKTATVEDFIEQGGSAPTLNQAKPEESTKAKRGRRPKKKREEVGVALRLPLDLIDRVDVAVDDQRIPLSRHQWILEAICDKLDRYEKRTK